MSQVTPAFPSYAQLQQTVPSPNAPSGGANSPNVPPQTGVGGWPPAGQPVPQPNFQQPPAQPNFQQPATQPAYSQPAPQPGFQQSPMQPAPASQQPVDPFIQQWEANQRLPPGRFKTTQELAEHLYLALDDVAGKLEEYEKRTPAPQQPTPPTQTAPPAAPVTQDLTQIAGMFQQNGMLAQEGGQWIAKNPLANGVAEQLNKAAMEAQLRQMELANPEAFVSKYGMSLVNNAVQPLQAKMDEIAKQNQMLQQRLESTLPRPDRDWVNQNRQVLYSKDAAGNEVPTQIGQLYTHAWDTAYNQGERDYGKIHEYAMKLIGPLVQPQQQPQPQASWMSSVGNKPPDPGFNAPGTVFTNNAPPGQGGVPVANDGFPRYNILQAHYQPQ